MADKGQGWQGQKGRHAKAGRGQKTSGKGFAGNTKDHSENAKRNATQEQGFIDKLI